MTRKTFIRASVALTLLILAVQAIWALSMPAFRGPDEPHHVNSIMRIASGEGWPEPGYPMVDTAIVEAGRESGVIREDSMTFTLADRTRLLHSRTTGQPFADTPVVPHRLRSPIYPVEKADPAAQEVDQMTQHPPLYYAGGALVVKTFQLEDAPWDRALLALRLYGLVLTIPLVPATIYTARRLGASRAWSLAGGLIPLAIPQLFGTSGVVTNDSLAIGSGALVVAALAKAGTERISWTNVLLVGGSLGLALWSKGLVLAFGLPLILVFMLNRYESWPRRITATLVSGTMALTIGWWWILNIVRYGVLQPAGYSRPIPDTWDGSDAEFLHYFWLAFQTFTKSFFSSFGWLEADFPQWLTWLLLTLLVVGLAWSVTKAGRSRTTYLILLSPFVGLIVLLYGQGWLNYVSSSAIAGVQGRYLYPCLAAFGGIVLGLQKLGRLGYWAFGIFAIGTGMVGFAWLLRSSYPGDAWTDLDRYAHVAGITVPVLVVALTVYALVNLILVILVFIWSGSAHLPAEPQSTADEPAVAGTIPSVTARSRKPHPVAGQGT